MPERLYTLRETCILLGMHPRTIQKWGKEGRIRVTRTLGGRRRIQESEIKRLQGETETKTSIGYARVSSGTQKDDLEHQVEYLKARGIREVIKDVGSGPNEKRRGYARLLGRVLSNEVGKVTVTRADRLTRFGFETLKQAFQTHGAEIEVLNGDELRTPQQELVEDLVTVISHFSGRLYGLRSHKYKEVVESAKNLFTEP